MEIFLDPTPRPGIIPVGANIHPGFGRVELCKDGVLVASDNGNDDHNIDWYTRYIKRRSDPLMISVWTLHIDGPFQSQVYAYTRHGWTLIETKDGFA